MTQRTAQARWEGSIKEGKGHVRFGSGAYEGPFSFQSRFEEGQGTNPEEMVGAAHAGCYSMAFSKILGEAGFTPQEIRTRANVKLEKTESGFEITGIHLETEVEAGDLPEEKFQELAEKARAGCVISKVLAGTKITLSAKRLQHH